MEISAIIQLVILIGIPVLWPIILAIYITRKVAPKFKYGRFAIYSLAGYGAIIPFFVLALLINSGLETIGYKCNNPETVSFAFLCSKSFWLFGNWFQSYLVFIPIWASQLTTTFVFKRHASI